MALTEQEELDAIDALARIGEPPVHSRGLYNDRPLQFFDISAVFRPADRIAYQVGGSGSGRSAPASPAEAV